MVFNIEITLCIEFFHQKDLKEANIMELKRVLTFTSVDDTTIHVRHFEVPKLTENAVNIEFREIGPRFTLRLRRTQLASGDLYKAACKKPKIANMDKKKAKKNVYTNELGEKRGKVYIQQQDLQTIATRKFKKQHPVPSKKQTEADEV
jgi:ribosome production factor 2